MNAQPSIPDDPSTVGIEARIRDLVPINVLADDLFQRLSVEIDFATAAKGDYLFREGDSDHENIYLLAGRVQLMAGKRVVDQVVAGSNMARFPLAHQWPRRYSARAADGVQYIRVDSRLLSDLLVRTQDQSYRVAELEAEGGGDWMSQVLKSRLFEQIPAANIQNVLRGMEEREVAKGEVVVRQGDPGEDYFMIVQGRAVVTRFEEEKVRVLAHLGAGDGFGEEALISGHPRAAAVTMVDRGVLVRLGREDFLEWVHRPLARYLDFEAAMAREGGVWLDIRSQEAFARGSLSGAINIPAERLRAAILDLDTQSEYFVCGEDLGEVAAAAFVLVEQGLRAYALDRPMADLVEGLLVSTTPAEGGLGDADGSTGDDARELAPSQSKSGSSPERPEDDPQGDIAGEVERLRGEISGRIREIHELRQRLAQREADLEALRQRKQALEQRVAELEAELEESEEVLQEASAEESAQQWERMRLLGRVNQLEQALAEQRSINAVLEEENSATLRRIEVLQQRMEPQDSARYD